MALVNCGECGKRVSELAGTCPHCGAPVFVIMHCPECARPIGIDSPRCPDCGYPFPWGTAQASGPAAAPNGILSTTAGMVETAVVEPAAEVMAKVINLQANAWIGILLGWLFGTAVVFSALGGMIRPA